MTQNSRGEGFFQAMLEESMDLFTVLDANGVIQYKSPSALRLLGYEAHEMVGHSAFEFVHPEDVPHVIEGLTRLVAGAEDAALAEFRFRHKDGSWRILESFGRNGLQHPQIQGIVVNSRDATQRRAMEAALRESEARNRAILTSSLDAVIIMNRHGIVVEWNPAAEGVFGYSAAEASGKRLSDLIIPPGFREAHEEGLRRYLETGVGPVLNQRLELPAMRQDGAEILVELVIVHLSNGSAPLFTGFVRDITESRAIVDALSESEARYARTVANVPGVLFVLVLHPDGRFSLPFVSDALRITHGLEPREVQENPRLLMDMVPAEDQPRFLARLQVSATELTPWEWEGRMVTAGGEKWMHSFSRPHKESNGDVVWDGLLTDLTERRRAEEALERARHEADTSRRAAEEATAEAERANLAKSEFLSRMSHELRTPLHAILGFSQLLERRGLETRDQHSVEQILKGGRHLLGLINEVLDIARIETGKMTLSPEPVQVLTICQEAVDLIHPLAETRNITLHKILDEATGIYVKADRQRLTQILLNLLSNAVKYNRQAGEVTVTAGLTPGGNVRFSVRDTGPGIPEDKFSLLFVPFERLGAEHTGVEGTGIGLALSQRLAAAMDGMISVESGAGTGTTFHLDLPLAPDPLAQMPSEPDPDAAISSPLDTKWVVLYIEDNHSNIQLMQGLLSERPEIRLLTATNGPLGLELARLHNPDVVLLDLHLPRMQGDEVLVHLRAQPGTAAIPVIVISADATMRQREKLESHGVRAYLTKPLDIDDFLGILDGVLAEAKPKQRS